MKILILLLGLSLGALSHPRSNIKEDAPTVCDATCLLPDCRCSSTEIPGGLTRSNTPQFVVLTFDDTVQASNMPYYTEAFNGRRNPDNCSASATFFITHEYNNYALVHDLHAAGHEIALHSITHKSDVEYWKSADVETLTREFVDQKIMMSRFAGVPAGDLKGIRMPFLQMAGNNQMKMLSDNGFTYDFSRETIQYANPGLWPYTYKHISTQDCAIAPCPTESFPKVWTLPMISWENDVQNQTCSMADACTNHNNVTGNYFQWMRREFWKQYFGNRAPFGVYLHSAWFQVNNRRYQEYKEFLDFLKQYDDVYIVSASRVIDWVKNPLTVAEMKYQICPRTYVPICSPKTCTLKNDENNERIFTSCSQVCPTKYPWLGNPLGN